jgi:glutathione S-transferase
MNLVLYYAPGTCALVPFVTLTEAGAQFEVRNVNTRKGGTRTEDYRRLNPKGKVPVLLIDGEALTENLALQIWIARQFPQARLLPADAAQEIKAISLMAWCASGIHPHLTPNAWPQRYCDLPGSEESVKRLANAQLFDDFALADSLLAGREWFCAHFTAVDAYFFWAFRRAMLFKLDVSRFAACAAHFERVTARPSVGKVLAHEKRVVEEFSRAA